MTEYIDSITFLEYRILVFLREIIERHKATFDPNDIRDFIDAFIVEMKRQGGYYQVNNYDSYCVF